MYYCKLCSILGLRQSTRILLLFLLSIFLNPFYLNGQYVGNHDVDSLWQVWNDSGQADSSRLKAVHQFCWNRLRNIRNDSMLILGNIVLDFADSLDNSEIMVDGLWFLGVAKGRDGKFLEGLSFFEKSLELSLEIGFDEGIARGFGSRGGSLSHQYRYKEALESLKLGLEISARIGYMDEVAHIYNLLGHLYLRQGNYNLALWNFENSLKISKEKKMAFRIRADRSNISFIKSLRGEYDEALQLLFEIKSELDQGDLQMGKAWNLIDIGEVYKIYGNYESSLEYFNKALEAWEKLEMPILIPELRFKIGDVYLEKSEYNNAFKNYETAIILNDELENKEGIALGQFKLGLLKYELQMFEESLDNINSAIVSFQNIGAKPKVAESYGLMGKVYLKYGDTINAHRSLSQGLAMNKEMGLVFEISNNYRDLARTYESQNRDTTALNYFNKSLKIKTQIGDKKGMSELYIDLALLYLKLNILDSSVVYCEKGFVLADKLMSLKLKQKAYVCKFEISKHLGDKQVTLQYLEQIEVWRDSLKTDEVYKQLQQMKFTRQRESDSLAMVEQNLKTELSYRETLSREKNTRNTFMFSGIGIFIVALGLFGRMRYVRRSNRELEEKNRLIALEKNRAEESEKAKEQFFNNVSHEFRTPLTLILGPLDSAIETTTDSELKPSLEVMHRNAVRLKGMINELLDLSKLEFGKVSLAASEENVVSLTANYLQSFESLADQQKVKLRFSSDKKVRMLWLDVEKYRKILANLLSNAFKFTDEGGSVSVEITPLAPLEGHSRQLKLNLITS